MAKQELAVTRKSRKKYLGDEHFCFSHLCCQTWVSVWRHTVHVLEGDTVKDGVGEEQDRK